MNYKEFGVKYDDSGNGMLEGYASTWIREPDSYGDVVKAGAFEKTLLNRWKGGEKIPLLWAHQMENLASYIGTAKANEDEKGLHFIATFDGTEEAQRVRELYKDGRLSKFSFAYDILDSEKITLEDGRKANELKELDLFEISCVCVPANDDAGVIDVKSVEPESKAGRRNRKADELIIRECIKSLESLLDNGADDTENEEAKSEETEPEINEASEESMESGNLTKAAELLEKIKIIKGDCEQ